MQYTNDWFIKGLLLYYGLVATAAAWHFPLFPRPVFGRVLSMQLTRCGPPPTHPPSEATRSPLWPRRTLARIPRAARRPRRTCGGSRSAQLAVGSASAARSTVLRVLVGSRRTHILGTTDEFTDCIQVHLVPPVLFILVVAPRPYMYVHPHVPVHLCTSTSNY